MTRLQFTTMSDVKNHSIRTLDWRYIRYANGDEELYDETRDPFEWTNLAADPTHAAKKAELAKLLPGTNAEDISSRQRKVPAKSKKQAEKKAIR